MSGTHIVEQIATTIQEVKCGIPTVVFTVISLIFLAIYIFMHHIIPLKRKGRLTRTHYWVGFTSFLLSVVSIVAAVFFTYGLYIAIGYALILMVMSIFTLYIKRKFFDKDVMFVD